MNLDEIIERDINIRKEYKDIVLLKHIYSEYDLKRYLLLYSSELLPRFPYVIEDEWFVISGLSQFGKGDLVFTDGKGCFAVVEIKYLRTDTGATARKSRNRAKNKLLDQVKYYVQGYKNKNPEHLQIEGYYYTNLDKFPKRIISR